MCRIYYSSKIATKIRRRKTTVAVAFYQVWIQVVERKQQQQQQQQHTAKETMMTVWLSKKKKENESHFL